MKKALSVLILTALTLLSHGAERRVPVLLVQFSDISFSSPESLIEAKADSAATYFSEQFRSDSFSFDLVPAITLSGTRAKYGRNGIDGFDQLIYLAVNEACMAVDHMVDFSRYDNDGDGDVDDVILIFAGVGEENGGGEDSIWPKYDEVRSYGLMLDGKKINGYSVCSETSSLGTLCHEYAHSFGLPDWYDTDGEGSGGLARGMWGCTSIMDMGRHDDHGRTPPGFNALELYLLGLGKCEELAEGRHTLLPIDGSQKYLRYGTDEEFYLFECREQSGWDAFIGGSGMLVYHVDRSRADAGYSDYYKVNLTAYERWEKNQVNCRPDHQCAHVVEADPDATDVSRIFFPQDGRTHFYLGSDGLALIDISKAGGGSVSFNVVKAVDMDSPTVFQDAAIVSWTVHDEIEGVQSYVLEWWQDNEDHESSTLPAGSTAFTIEGLKPGTDYNFTLSAVIDEGNDFKVASGFRTWSVPSETPPYIYLNSVERNSDGSFVKGAKLPLRVFNAVGAAEVRWYMDGKRISTGDDGWYHLDGSGTLKAEILWEKGGSDIIMKKMNVR